MRSRLYVGPATSAEAEPGEQRVLVLRAQPGTALARRLGRHVVGTVDRLAAVEVDRPVHVAVERVVLRRRELRAVVPAVVLQRRVVAEGADDLLVGGLPAGSPVDVLNTNFTPLLPSPANMTWHVLSIEHPPRRTDRRVRPGSAIDCADSSARSSSLPGTMSARLIGRCSAIRAAHSCWRVNGPDTPSTASCRQPVAGEQLVELALLRGDAARSDRHLGNAALARR